MVSGSRGQDWIQYSECSQGGREEVPSACSTHLMLYCELGSRVAITLSKLSDLPLTKAGYGLTSFSVCF